MKTLLLTFMLSLGSYSAFAAGNYSDDLDKNTTPGVLEERENEEVNSTDAFDTNTVPSSMEEREKEEALESDALQKDDPEKSYDPLDQEIDE
jgi:hypothetical protein